jgi:ribonuclease HII
MEKLHKEYPEYNWRNNKGYPTKEHKLSINKYGITKYHRKSFKLYDEQLKINF